MSKLIRTSIVGLLTVALACCIFGFLSPLASDQGGYLYAYASEPTVVNTDEASWSLCASLVGLDYETITSVIFSGKEPQYSTGLTGEVVSARFDCVDLFPTAEYIYLYVSGSGFTEEDAARFGELWNDNEPQRYTSLGWNQADLTEENMNECYWSFRQSFNLPKPFALLDQDSGKWADSLYGTSYKNGDNALLVGQAFGQCQMNGQDAYWSTSLMTSGANQGGPVVIEFHRLGEGEVASYEDLEKKYGLISYDEAMKTANNSQGSQGGLFSGFFSGFFRAIQNYAWQIAVAIGVIAVTAAARRLLAHIKRNKTASGSTRSLDSSQNPEPQTTPKKTVTQKPKESKRTTLREEDQYYAYIESLRGQGSSEKQLDAVYFKVNKKVEDVYSILSQWVASHYEAKVEDWGNGKRVIKVLVNHRLDSQAKPTNTTVAIVCGPLAKQTAVGLTPSCIFEDFTIEDVPVHTTTERESGVAAGECMLGVESLVKQMDPSAQRIVSMESFLKSLSPEDTMSFMGVGINLQSLMQNATIERRSVDSMTQEEKAAFDAVQPISTISVDEDTSAKNLSSSGSGTSEADLVGILVAGVGGNLYEAADILRSHTHLSAAEAETFFREIPEEKWSDLAAEYMRRLAAEQ